MTRRHGESVYYRAGRRQWVAVADLGWREGKRDRREFTSTKGKRDALLKRDAFLHQRAGGFTLPRGRPPTVSEWLAHWLHKVARGKVAETTWHKGYRPAIEDRAMPFFARIPLSELTEEDIEAWHSWLGRQRGRRGPYLSGTTVANAHRVLSIALREAVVRGKLSRNPCVNVPAPPRNQAEMRPPSSAEVQLILDRCKTWPNGARWVLAITTGLRQGEALALQWRDVKLDGPSPSVSVRRSRARVNHEWVVKEPKSASSRRTVTLPAVAAAALRAHRKGSIRDLRNENDLVFTTRGGQPVGGSSDWRDLQALLKDLGLPRYRVHDLRHYHVTWLFELGVDERAIQERVGHSHVAVTRGVYQHVTEALQARAVTAMDQALGFASHSASQAGTPGATRDTRDT